jgi:membrane associated rhomboid family serine protease
MVSMLVTTVAIATKNPAFGNWLIFDSRAVWSGQIWRLATYVIWNPPTMAFAMQMLMLWWFGRELEDFFGRRIFLKLCAGLVLVPAFAGMVLGISQRVQWSGLSAVFSLFIAYATMAPQVSLLFGVSAMWMAILFLGLNVLECLSSQRWGEMVMTIAGAGFAFSYVRYEQGRWELPQLTPLLKPANKVQFRVLEPVAHANSKVAQAPEEDGGEEGMALESIDPLLEKIGRSGLASLTEDERLQLQLAREALLRRESSKH